jgi:hypothetical protein
MIAFHTGKDDLAHVRPDDLSRILTTLPGNRLLAADILCRDATA